MPVYRAESDQHTYTNIFMQFSVLSVDTICNNMQMLTRIHIELYIYKCKQLVQFQEQLGQQNTVLYNLITYICKT